jgi:hypothetical protein
MQNKSAQFDPFTFILIWVILAAIVIFALLFATSRECYGKMDADRDAIRTHDSDIQMDSLLVGLYCPDDKFHPIAGPACTSGQMDNCKDNCPIVPNGPNGGTCIVGAGTTIGKSCNSNSKCDIEALDMGVCSMAQEDLDNDGVGDACDPSPCGEVVGGEDCQISMKKLYNQDRIEELQELIDDNQEIDSEQQGSPAAVVPESQE